MKILKRSALLLALIVYALYANVQLCFAQDMGLCLEGVDAVPCECPRDSGTSCSKVVCRGSDCPSNVTCSINDISTACNFQTETQGSSWTTDICVGESCDSQISCSSDHEHVSCSCASGYTGTICTTDIDECASTPCFNGGLCSDGIGTFTCACRDGYAGSRCQIDIDECTTGLNICDDATTDCVNTVGSYMCVCKSGFYGMHTTSGKTRCSDINECSFSFTHLCDTRTSRCHNTAGKYECRCEPGYSGEISTGMAATCIDDDECSLPTHSCNTFTSTCMNIAGSYECHCNRGYIGSTTTGIQATCIWDTSPPVVTCPRTTYTTIDVSQQMGTVTWSAATATDNSGSPMFESVSQESGTSFPIGTTQVTYTYSDPAGNEGTCTFEVRVSTDCQALYSNRICDITDCSCTNGECEPQKGICRNQCSVFDCAADFESQSLDQVNPQSPANISCSLSGPTSVVNQLEIKLSKSRDGIADQGITTHLDDTSNGQRHSTFRVEAVAENETLFCQLYHESFLIASLEASEFVYVLPRFAATPVPTTTSYTSVTITWPEWDEGNDVGDPPVVAYTPYYKAAESTEWITGPLLLDYQSLEYTVSGLMEDTHYTFSVAAVREGEGGTGPRGPSLTVKTFCNVAHVAPEVTGTELIGMNNVNVTWKFQSDVECSTDIVTFTVYYEKFGVGGKSIGGHTTGNWLVVDEKLLEPAASYTFYVTVTLDEESEFSRITPASQIMTTIQESRDGVGIVIIAVVSTLCGVLVIIVVLLIKQRQRNQQNTGNGMALTARTTAQAPAPSSPGRHSKSPASSVTPGPDVYSGTIYSGPDAYEAVRPNSNAYESVQ